MKFAFEKPTIRLYKYYFLGIKEPVTIQAYNKAESRRILLNIKSKLDQKYQDSPVIGETVTVPVIGISERTSGGKTFVWAGEGRGNSGWIDKEFLDK